MSEGGQAGDGVGGRAERGARAGYLGLGSNLGDRRANLQRATDRLAALGVRPVASSRVYASEPVGLVTDQPEFLNVCLKIETALGAEQLLAICKGVEHELGRVPTVRHGPRLIDIDILALGEEQVELDQLQVPHRELRNRRFVLAPLLDIVEDGVLPGVGEIAKLLAELSEPGDVIAVAPPLTV